MPRESTASVSLLYLLNYKVKQTPESKYDRNLLNEFTLNFTNCSLCVPFDGMIKQCKSDHQMWYRRLGIWSMTNTVRVSLCWLILCYVNSQMSLCFCTFQTLRNTEVHPENGKILVFKSWWEKTVESFVLLTCFQNWHRKDFLFPQTSSWQLDVQGWRGCFLWWIWQSYAHKMVRARSFCSFDTVWSDAPSVF